MSPDPLLNLLADKQFHSGESLGLSLGISRAAVWKRVKKLESLGVEINSIRGKGYRLNKSLDLFEIHEILKELSAEVISQLSELEILLSVDSTNSRVMSYVEKGSGVCLAEQQTNGRGRRGKKWISPFGKNIYLSLCWYFQGGAAQLEGLSLAVAVAVARALEDCGVKDVNVKWPNDLLHQNRKLAGILLEMSGDADGACKVVIGVGVNVNMQHGVFDIDQPWIDVFTATQKVISRNKLAGKIINHLFVMLEQFQKYGFSIFKSEWLSKDLYFGKQVKLSTSSIVVEGIERGVDDSGALFLEVDTEVKRFHGGEISVRSI
jgi:BirA family transcriptional regulator, biotin operon repressor / biotin---[acetyl-CoA-carboxylase] ligase